MELDPKLPWYQVQVGVDYRQRPYTLEYLPLDLLVACLWFHPDLHEDMWTRPRTNRDGGRRVVGHAMEVLATTWVGLMGHCW
jgi:hypothetical protein